MAGERTALAIWSVKVIPPSGVGSGFRAVLTTGLTAHKSAEWRGRCGLLYAPVPNTEARKRGLPSGGPVRPAFFGLKVAH